MLEKIPSHEDIEKLIGSSAVAAWDELTEFVVANYEFEPVWDDGGKHAIWEVKYRRSGKTLCVFYMKDDYFTVLIVLGKAEIEKFELSMGDFNSEAVELYESTHQYHDGKWLWISLKDHSLVEDVKKLIVIKKKPKKASV
ncbi:MAG: hypothetical protein A2Y23_04845 [Clostridiales bacterium GWB2_37_7]|nr:MAG: hypothetical protein A2Y23_04845 [Clostridiales bacterium GWB2_37_7]